MQRNLLIVSMFLVFLAFTSQAQSEQGETIFTDSSPTAQFKCKDPDTGVQINESYLEGKGYVKSFAITLDRDVPIKKMRLCRNGKLIWVTSRVGGQPLVIPRGSVIWPLPLPFWLVFTVFPAAKNSSQD